jgi:hypothetical protein
MAVNERVSAKPPKGDPSITGSSSGQAVIEYILLLTVIVSAYMTLSSWAARFGLAQKLATPVTQDFAKAYKYGDIKASGFDEGDPKRHPRISGCDGCFRIFINPKVN